MHGQKYYGPDPGGLPGTKGMIQFSTTDDTGDTVQSPEVTTDLPQNGARTHKNLFSLCGSSCLFVANQQSSRFAHACHPSSKTLSIHRRI
jgi:hypothetical protein